MKLLLLFYVAAPQNNAPLRSSFCFLSHHAFFIASRVAHRITRFSSHHGCDERGWAARDVPGALARNARRWTAGLRNSAGSSRLGRAVFADLRAVAYPALAASVMRRKTMHPCRRPLFFIASRVLHRITDAMSARNLLADLLCTGAALWRRHPLPQKREQRALGEG